MKKLNRIIIYIIGMIILALGLSLSTKTKLGVSALTSFPYMLSEIYNLKFGDITLIYYIFLILIEIILHIIMKQKKMIINDILSIFLSIIFTRGMNIFISFFPDITNNYIYKILLMLLAIIFIGVGISLTVVSKLVPNPADGLVSTISEFTKKNMGLIKNICDITCVSITVILSLILKNKIIGVGIGTLMAMLLVGRVVYIFNKLFENKIKKIIGC